MARKHHNQVAHAKLRAAARRDKITRAEASARRTSQVADLRARNAHAVVHLIRKNRVLTDGASRVARAHLK
jgi:hypothetical protein